MVLLLALIVSLALLLQVLHAANIGDEQYGNVAGLFYVWTKTGGLNLVDPTSGSIVKTVPVTDYTTMSWGDAVFMRDQAQIRKYAFIADTGNNLMWVYDTDAQALITRVKTGSKPVHVYGIPANDEVWAHLDGDGSFDVFHMNQVRYRSSSAAAKDYASIPGHGKLLTNPNLERIAFSTDVNAGIVTRIDTLLRVNTATLTISNNTMATTYGQTCGGTHGIAFSDVDNSLYVECTNPSTCVSPYNTAACTGSLWKIDTASFPGNTATALQLGGNPAQPSRQRLSSPFLSNKLGISNFGIQGQSYATPEEQFILCPSKNNNVLSIIKPVSGGSPLILEVEVNYKPGSVVFYPKDSSITFGVDPNPENYWAVIALESSDDNSGLAFLDMALVVQGFAKGSVLLDKTVVQYVKIGAGATYRPLKRGTDYIATPIYDSTVLGYTKLAIVNARTQTVSTVLPLAGVAKILWVPNLQANWASSVASVSQALVDQSNKFNSAYTNALAVGGVALAFVLGGFCAVTALVLYNNAHNLRYLQSLHSAGKDNTKVSDHGFTQNKLSDHGFASLEVNGDGDV